MGIQQGEICGHTCSWRTPEDPSREEEEEVEEVVVVVEEEEEEEERRPEPRRRPRVEAPSGR